MNAFLGGVAAMVAVSLIAVYTVGVMDHSVIGRSASSESVRLGE
jgi:hypothetical protein